LAASGDAGDRAALEIPAKPVDASLECAANKDGSTERSNDPADSTAPRSGLDMNLIHFSLALVALPIADRARTRTRYPDRTFHRPGTARRPRDATP
jgi:hypothetical protein